VSRVSGVRPTLEYLISQIRRISGIRGVMSTRGISGIRGVMSTRGIRGVKEY
jgi:PII-like signaling protein